METIITSGITVLAIILTIRWGARKYNRRMNGIVADELGKTERKNAKLVYHIFLKMNCAVSIDGDCAISVTYRDSYFYLEFGGRGCRIWEPCWGMINEDSPDLMNFMKAMNAANREFDPVIVLSPRN